ncbi:hypothetical protein Cpir12675_003401 [Ceratocystis pirilliformis]|uniref:DUF3638 domain-containing protein n=1 Tax=Ceratocystis pirilliformis TaxID=259994 RepID=A0ABR3Z6I7_9PEZI
MILQCIHQMGPKDEFGNKRVSVIIVDDDLASKIVTSLEIALCRFEENWDSSVELMTLKFIATQDWVALESELGNIGHLNLSLEEYLSSLLLEIDLGLKIREVQQNNASLMIKPPSDQYSVTQLNMRECKSSVIVTIVSAALENKQRLICVVVAKPQSKQMPETLLIKLGGLVNHRAFQMPYSRGLITTEAQAQLLLRLLQDCQILGDEVLSLVTANIGTVQEKFPQSVEISQHRAGCFPRIRILKVNAIQFLAKKVAKTIYNNGITSFSIIITQPASRRRLAETYLLNIDISASDGVKVEKAFINGKDTGEPFSGLLLLRGLFSMGVLAFGLMKKPWRVDYGLDASRTPKNMFCYTLPCKGHSLSKSRVQSSQCQDGFNLSELLPCRPKRLRAIPVLRRAEAGQRAKDRLCTLD